jgi:hypothetical protein
MSLNFCFKSAAELCAWVRPGDPLIHGTARKLSEFSEEAHSYPFHITQLAAYRQVFGRNYRVYVRETAHYDYQGGMVSTGHMYLGTLSGEQCRGLQGFDTRHVQSEAYRLRAELPRGQWKVDRVRREIYFQALVKHVQRAQQIRQMFTQRL